MVYYTGWLYAFGYSLTAVLGWLPLASSFAWTVTTFSTILTYCAALIKSCFYCAIISSCSLTLFCIAFSFSLATLALICSLCIYSLSFPASILSPFCSSYSCSIFLSRACISPFCLSISSCRFLITADSPAFWVIKACTRYNCSVN